MELISGTALWAGSLGCEVLVTHHEDIHLRDRITSARSLDKKKWISSPSDGKGRGGGMTK